MANKFGMTDEALAKLVEREQARKDKDRRAYTTQKLLLRKAKDAGINVSDAEIDAELAKMGA
jgi:hypothetical protein